MHFTSRRLYHDSISRWHTFKVPLQLLGIFQGNRGADLTSNLSGGAGEKMTKPRLHQPHSVFIFAECVS